MFTCPECGHNIIVWSYNTGYIVCGNCGLVVDKIYDYNLTRKIKESPNNLSDYEIKRFKHKIRKIISRYCHYEKFIKRTFKLKPGLRFSLKIAEQAYMGKQVKLVRTIISEKTEEIKHKVLKGNGTYKLILEEFKKYPRIASRTDRVKIALAVIVYNELKNGVKPSITSIAKEFGISIANLRKAYSDLRRYKEIYENLKLIVERAMPYEKETIYNKNTIKQATMGSAL